MQKDKNGRMVVWVDSQVLAQVRFRAAQAQLLNDGYRVSVTDTVSALLADALERHGEGAPQFILSRVKQRESAQ